VSHVQPHSNDSIFSYAIKHNDLDIIAFIQRYSPDASLTPSQGRKTPLMLAAEYNSLAVVQAMIRGGQNVNAVDESQTSVLVYATANPHPFEIITTLLSAGATVNVADGDGITPLMAAAEIDSLEVVARLLAAGAYVDAKAKSGLTPLMAATKNKSADVAQALIRAGAGVNSVDQDGVTPLMMVVQNDSPLAVLNALIQAGASVNAVSWRCEMERQAYYGEVKRVCHENYGHSAIIIAARKNSVQMIRILISAGANVNYRGSLQEENDKTPLIFAAEQLSVEAVRAFIAAGANVNDVVAEQTPLMYVVAESRPPERVPDEIAVIQALIKGGANTQFARSYKPRTAYDIAKKNGADSRVLKLLR
jgi:uncharacterized protein